MPLINDIHATETVHASQTNELETIIGNIRAELDKVSAPPVQAVESVMSRVETWLKSEGKYAETEMEAALARLKAMF
jgi:hypothetical protein